MAHISYDTILPAASGLNNHNGSRSFISGLTIEGVLGHRQLQTAHVH